VNLVYYRLAWNPKRRAYQVLLLHNQRLIVNAGFWGADELPQAHKWARAMVAHHLTTLDYPATS